MGAITPKYTTDGGPKEGTLVLGEARWPSSGHMPSKSSRMFVFSSNSNSSQREAVPLICCLNSRVGYKWFDQVIGLLSNRRHVPWLSTEFRWREKTRYVRANTALILFKKWAFRRKWGWDQSHCYPWRTRGSPTREDSLLHLNHSAMWRSSCQKLKPTIPNFCTGAYIRFRLACYTLRLICFLD